MVIAVSSMILMSITLPNIYIVGSSSITAGFVAIYMYTQYETIDFESIDKLYRFDILCLFITFIWFCIYIAEASANIVSASSTGNPEVFLYAVLKSSTL